ncbi:Crp/Fnr family transcriptional regulator [Janibacter alittae]|uniref:Crp/Fnr family transcriptional regulator n=1 Tax=Janibacter alittae TaxID=3115209 RepID=A0ABZ2MIN1_9MICO
MSRTQLPVIQDSPDDLCVARVPLFQGLSHQELLGVARLARPRELATGEQVYAAGADASQLLVVHTGAVKVARLGPSGYEHLIRVLGPGDFVGESAFLSGRPPTHYATATEPSSLCTFQHSDLGRLVRSHPSIGLRMLQDVSGRLQDTESRLVSLTSGDVTSRLANYLLSLRGRAGAEGLEVALPLAKKDIASLLDTTPESLSRQLRHLRESGVVTPRGTRGLLIRDADALMGLASGS